MAIHHLHIWNIDRWHVMTIVVMCNTDRLYYTLLQSDKYCTRLCLAKIIIQDTLFGRLSYRNLKQSCQFLAVCLINPVVGFLTA